jgi:hypothetical protein
MVQTAYGKDCTPLGTGSRPSVLRELTGVLLKCMNIEIDLHKNTSCAIADIPDK